MSKSSPFPKNILLKVISENSHGELIAEAVEDKNFRPKTKIWVGENRRIKPSLAIGDVFLGKVQEKNHTFYAKPIMRMSMQDGNNEKVYGIVVQRENQFYLKPPGRKVFMEYLLDNHQGVKKGDFISAALCGDKKFKTLHILKNFGPFNLNQAITEALFEQAEVPSLFSDAVKKEAANLAEFTTQGREDLTQIPLVTIDGDDSKDFDDAIYASKTDSGFQLIVAIADVAYYVRDGSEIDREAYKRGNSVYLPNIVLPMLPLRLSNDLCSLNPKVVRPVIACFMEIDNNGNLLNYRFNRAVMKSAARLTYREVEKAFEGELNDNTRPLFKTVIQPLYEAYFAFAKARQKRGALDIESSEIKIKVNQSGTVESVKKAEDYTSNKVIEEFMVAANVAAALVLKNKKLPIMYRIHDKPNQEKLVELAPLLRSFKLKLPDYASIQPANFNKLLDIGAKNGCKAVISNLVLRMQSQAQYSPHNIGHFGLALTDYAHFTSPIRRYSDLLIHRTLIKALNLEGGGGLNDADDELFVTIGEHLVATERRAVSLERDITAKYLSSYLEPSIGTNFEVRVSGVSKAGLFVTIESLGAEGFIPMRILPYDNYILEDGGFALRGQRSKLLFTLGSKITATLIEATPISGGLLFKYLDDSKDIDYPTKKNTSKPKLNKKLRKEKLKRKNAEKKAPKDPN